MPRTDSATFTGTVWLSYPTSTRQTARTAILHLDVDDSFYEVTLTSEQLLELMSTLVVDGVTVEHTRRIFPAVRS
jgi:hypothetical protein